MHADEKKRLARKTEREVAIVRNASRATRAKGVTGAVSSKRTTSPDA